MVVQSRWKKRLIAGLALAGLTCGTATSLPRPRLAAAENADRIVTVADHGKPGQKCRVLRSWRTQDGDQAYEVQSLETAEFMTVVESGPPTTLPGPRPGTRVQVRSTKIYHWGRHDSPPPGAPVPPGAGETSSARSRPEPSRTVSPPPRVATAGQQSRPSRERPMPEVDDDDPVTTPPRVQPVDPVLTKLTEIEQRLRDIENRPPVVLQPPPPPPPPVPIQEPVPPPPSPTPGRAAIINLPDRPLLPVDHGPVPTPLVTQRPLPPTPSYPAMPNVQTPQWQPVPDPVQSQPVIRVEDRQPRVIVPLQPPAPMPPETPIIMPTPVQVPPLPEPTPPSPAIIEIKPPVMEQPVVRSTPVEAPAPVVLPSVPEMPPVIEQPRTAPTPEPLPRVETPVTLPRVETPPAPPKIETPVAPPQVETPPAPPAIEEPPAPPKVETPPTPPRVETPVAPPKVEMPATPPRIEEPPAPPKVEIPAPTPMPAPMPMEPPVVPPTIVQPTPPMPEPPTPLIETPTPAAPMPPAIDAATVERHLTGLRDRMLPSERERAAEALLGVDLKQHPNVIQALVTAAKTDPAATVRVCCLRALVKLNANTPSVLSLVDELEKDRDIRVSSEAQWARRQLRDGK